MRWIYTLKYPLQSYSHCTLFIFLSHFPQNVFTFSISLSVSLSQQTGTCTCSRTHADAASHLHCGCDLPHTNKKAFEEQLCFPELTVCVLGWRVTQAWLFILFFSVTLWVFTDAFAEKCGQSVSQSHHITAWLDERDLGCIVKGGWHPHLFQFPKSPPLGMDFCLLDHHYCFWGPETYKIKRTWRSWSNSEWIIWTLQHDST